MVEVGQALRHDNSPMDEPRAASVGSVLARHFVVGIFPGEPRRQTAPRDQSR